MGAREFLIVGGCVLALGSASQASASETLTYTGASFQDVHGLYTADDYVSGFVVVADPLGTTSPLHSVTVSSFSFSDGVQTLTEANTTPGLNDFEFATDGLGNITSWNVALRGTQTSIDTHNKPFVVFDSGSTDNFQHNYGSVGTPGTWAIENSAPAVPEPSVWALLLSGFAGLGLVLRSRRTNQSERRGIA